MSTDSSESITSRMTSALSAIPWGIWVGGGLSAAFFLTSFILTSDKVGSSSNWYEKKTEIMTKVWPLTLLGTLALFLTSALYILQDPKNTMYFLLVIGCLSLGLAYSALVISVIST